jgi:hypothetical protein
VYSIVLHAPLTVIRTQVSLLVREMRDLGQELLQKVGGVNLKKPGSHILGFHVPPGGSVPHLHLHAIDTASQEWEPAKYNIQTYPYLSFDEAVHGIETEGSLQSYWNEKLAKSTAIRDWSASHGKHNNLMLWGDARPKRDGDRFTRLKKRHRFLQ